MAETRVESRDAQDDVQGSIVAYYRTGTVSVDRLCGYLFDFGLSGGNHVYPLVCNHAKSPVRSDYAFCESNVSMYSLHEFYEL